MSVDTSNPIGFIPRHPAPARYLRTRVHYKKDKAFDRVFLAQELLDGARTPSRAADRRRSSLGNEDGTGSAIWALAFSKDGKFLAAAGQDKKVRVWAVISNPEERADATKGGEDTPTDQPPRLNAPVFHPKPVRVFDGHTGSILDLSWSKVWPPQGGEKGPCWKQADRNLEQLSPFFVDGQDCSFMARQSD
jgi:WD40 repeat protein